MLNLQYNLSQIALKPTLTICSTNFHGKRRYKGIWSLKKLIETIPSVAFSILLSVIMSEILEVEVVMIGHGRGLSLNPNWLFSTVLGNKIVYTS
jgi:hypothetical protein